MPDVFGCNLRILCHLVSSPEIHEYSTVKAELNLSSCFKINNSLATNSLWNPNAIVRETLAGEFERFPFLFRFYARSTSLSFLAYRSLDMCRRGPLSRARMWAPKHSRGKSFLSSLVLHASGRKRRRRRNHGRLKRTTEEKLQRQLRALLNRER